MALGAREVFDSQTANQVASLASIAGVKGLPSFLQAEADRAAALAQNALDAQSSLIESLSAGAARQVNVSQAVEEGSKLSPRNRRSSCVSEALNQEPDAKVKESGVQEVGKQSETLLNERSKKPQQGIER